MKLSPLTAALLFLLASGATQAQPLPPGKASPQAPTITALSSTGAQRGTSVELTVTGTNLTEATGLWTSFPAKVTIPTDANNGKNAASLRVKLDVPADAPLGFQSLRIVTKKGVSNARLFCIDDLPQVAEVPSNHGLKAAQPLAPPCVVLGHADAEATDYFKVSVKPNQRLSVEVLGRRLGSQIDPQITLFDAAGKELPGGHSNDAPGLQTDARLSYTFQQGGEIVIAVRDVSYRGGGDFHYRLRVGDFPCATTPLPLAVKRGTKAMVGFAGPFVDGVAAVEVQAPTDPAVQALQVAPRGGNGLHGWPVTLHLSDLDEQTEREPNNDPKQANRVAVPGAVTARFEQKDDVDHFAFAAKKGQRWVIEAHTAEHLSPTEVYMALRNAKGEQVQATNPAQAAKLDFTAPADGDYTLAVEHLHSWGGPDEVYRVTFTPFQPEFTLNLNLDRWELMPGATVSVPLFVQRAGYNGPIEVSVLGKGLTGSLTIPAGAAKPNVPAGTLAIKADDALTPGPVAFALQAKAVIDGKPVARLASVHGLVSAALGNLPVTPRAMDTQLAVAVLERPPFALALKLDAPEATAGKPLAATVTVTNAPGFADDVALSVEGLQARPVLMSVKSQGLVTTLKVVLPVPADAKPGPNSVVLAGSAKQHGRDWTIRSAPASLVVKK
ncbi:MAG: hypothetical protein U0797_14800 [Gemmataceae bacterium]